MSDGVDNLFCIKVKTPEEGFDMLLMLSDYDLLFTIMTNYDDEPNTVVLVVHENHCVGHSDDANNEFGLAETSLQMNYRQVGSILVCPVCEKKGLDICGHLTFGSKINSIF